MKTITLQEALELCSIQSGGKIETHPENRRFLIFKNVKGDIETFARTNDEQLCHEADAALLAHCFNTLPDLVAAIRLDLAFHSRFFATTSLEDFRAMGYMGSDDANQMRDFLHKLKVDAMTKASQVQIPD